MGAQLEMLVVQREHHGRPQWMHLVQSGRDVDAQVEAQDVTMWAGRWNCPQWVQLLRATVPERCHRDPGRIASRQSVW